MKTEIDDDPRLRFRVYVDGVLVEEVWLDAENDADHERVLAIRERHKAMADQADADGKHWMVEVYEPALPKDRAYTRFGTDANGMVDPRPTKREHDA